MKANDWVRVYHATGIDSHDSRGGPQNMVFGIDALGEQRSKYHPSVPGGYSYKGLYVGPTKQSVGKFGGLIFELAVRVNNLHATDWSANISRKWKEGGASTWQGEDLKWVKEKCTEDYPVSFNPILSGALDPSTHSNTCSGMISGTEPQALFIGIVPAKNVLAVHYMDDTYTPQEFIEKFRDNLGWSEQQIADPKSTRLTWEQYEAITLAKFGGRKDMKSIASTLFRYYLLYDENRVFDLLKQIAPFSQPSLEKFWGMIKNRYCDDFVALWKTLREKRPDLELDTPPTCNQ